MRPQRTPMKPPRKGCLRNPNAPTDPVEVCARIRNLTNKSDSGCIKIMNDTTLQLHSSEGRVTECQFYRLFNKHVGQKELFSHVAEPMVEDLVKGKSGLLFTYGVTSSGKTYTMTGTVDEPGFLPRSLDMIFNSISHLQASKYVFVPDGMNGFSVQSEADALLDKQERDFLPQLTPRTPSKRQKHTEVRYDVDHCLSENVNPDCRYALFVSYVEIYNDYIYDLLGDTQLDMFNRPKPPQSKRLREDRNKNMFVYGVSQVEVKTTQEAFAAFQQGQERRRIAHTQLNAESSRSHSIFNIRLVQAPLDPLGEDLLQERSLICISQLSLVDLAGSERMGRTGAGGERLREAGNINSSLMTLRRCLEQLRENQRNGTCEMVKYRNSKLTHLFKNYFEGRGKVKMVVCLNPNSQEYEENMHVIQFAEVAQQVEVVRSEEYKVDRESIRKKAAEVKMRQEEERKRQQTAMRQLNSEASGHRLFKRSRSRQIATSSESESPLTDMETDYEGLEINLGNLGSSFPSLEVADAMDEETLPALIAFLESRISAVHSVRKTTESLGTLFRGNLLNQTSSDRDLQSRMKECQEELSSKTKDLAKIERQVKKLESKNQVLTRTTQVYEKDKKNLQDQLNDAEMQTKSLSMANRKMELKLRGAVENTKAQLERECEKRVRSVQTEMQEKMWVKDERLRQARNILVRSDGREGRTTTRQLTPSTSSSTSVSTPHPKLKQRRSRSAENILSERKSLSKSRNKSTSDHDLRSNKAKKSTVAADETECDEERNAQKDDGDRGVMTRSRIKRLYSNEGGDNNSLVDAQENERNLGCRYVNKRDELKFRRRPVIVAPKHRRSQSANARNWLAHYPNSTVQPETILQPCIKPNRVVSVPSPKDVAGANKYILTHQHEDKDGEIETQLVKGEVFHTRTGGQQVQFVDIETLKQSDPQKKSPNKKRKSATSMDELSSGEQSSWTDVETRCAFGVGVMNSAAKRKK